MANYSVARSKHATLAANTQDQITLTTTEQNRVEVLNRDPAGWLYFTVDNSNAVIEGDNTFAVPPNSSVSVANLSVEWQTVVHLISSVAAKYSVTGYAGED